MDKREGVRMSKLINADAFFEDFAEIRDYEYASQEYEVDAVEVVRCRDCVHWRKPDSPCPFGLLRFNTSPPNGFCHLGERKEDE